MWISWNAQIQLYIWDAQGSALNNFYSSLGSLSGESESKKRFMWFSCLRYSPEKPVQSEGSPRMACLFPTVVPFLNACLLTLYTWQVLWSEHLQRQLVEDRIFYRNSNILPEDSTDKGTYLISGRILFNFIFSFKPWSFLWWKTRGNLHVSNI